MHPLIFDPFGRPVSAAQSDKCPGCGAGPESRQPSGGFGGDLHPVCMKCGHEFKEQRCPPKNFE